MLDRVITLLEPAARRPGDSGAVQRRLEALIAPVDVDSARRLMDLIEVAKSHQIDAEPLAQALTAVITRQLRNADPPEHALEDRARFRGFVGERKPPAVVLPAT